VSSEADPPPCGGNHCVPAARLAVARADFDRWAEWARQEADRIDPVKNGTIMQAVNEHPDGQ
jgi:hypothetical protein